MEHYHAATNLELLQANMTWCHRNRGPEYHWIPKLYSKNGLPLLDGIQEMCQQDNENRYKRLQLYKTVEGKRKRVQRKVNRAKEQKLRKRYVKNCQIQHTYGENVEDDLVEKEAVLRTESAIKDGTATGLVIPDTITAASNGAIVEVGGKKCKWCGSTTHSRKSHKDCPYNNSRV